MTEIERLKAEIAEKDRQIAALRNHRRLQAQADVEPGARAVLRSLGLRCPGDNDDPPEAA